MAMAGVEHQPRAGNERRHLALDVGADEPVLLATDDQGG
jgi:hypothetical protein